MCNCQTKVKLLLNFFNKKFDSYGKALGKYLNTKGLQNRWLAERMAENPEKVHNIESQISRWVNKGKNPVKNTQQKINKILNICIEADNTGKWVISRTENGSPGIPGAKTRFSIDELLKEERSRLGISDIPDTELGRDLQGILDDAVSLVLKLRRSIEIEKGRSDSG